MTHYNRHANRQIIIQEPYQDPNVLKTMHTIN